MRAAVPFVFGVLLTTAAASIIALFVAPDATQTSASIFLPDEVSSAILQLEADFANQPRHDTYDDDGKLISALRTLERKAHLFLLITHGAANRRRLSITSAAPAGDKKTGHDNQISVAKQTPLLGQLALTPRIFMSLERERSKPLPH
ncbi:hypothetical protein JQ596_38255 [Bradyrhizobium manausense]|uniref:hypothetical protein n=1 Tax=Bradyrhizobium manausense TaxID=989370 RepID=UPI001BA92227|nr:hypothetical protein [Bradyrhizobium manausense]MBR0831365.1 hypothetical protein [Bradyrhizobium manausense]